MAKLLRIDLSTESIDIDDITELQREFIGGTGVNTKLLYDMIPQSADPLGPKNVLVFGIGPLAGTGIPCSNRTEVTAKSPLTGRIGYANSGGFFGPNLKYAGFDNIVIVGKATRPVYIYINNEKVKIEDAANLWGKDAWRTIDEIRVEKGNDVKIACIGQGGENLVRFASVQNGYANGWGRSGLGTVMGSKNLKAIAVRGTNGVKVKNISGTLSLMEELYRKTKADASYDAFKKYGTMIASDSYEKVGYHGYKNYRFGRIPNWLEKGGKQVLVDKYKERDLACFGCHMACGNWLKVKEGNLLGIEGKGVEVTAAVEFGGRLGLESIAEMLYCSQLCAQYSLDFQSAAAVVAFAIDLYERGVLGRKSTGLELAWGDLETITELLHMIAYREGIGNILAEGVKIAAKNIPGAEKYAYYIKGMEMPARDPRGKWDGWIMGYLTGTRGGDHLRTRPPSDLQSRPEIEPRSYIEMPLQVSADFIKNLDMPQELKTKMYGDPPTKVYLPLAVKYAEDMGSVINSLGMCNRPAIRNVVGPEFCCRALKAVTGVDYTPAELLNIGEKVWNLQHEFNIREGETRDEYVFPAKFYKEDLPAGSDKKPRLDKEKINEALEQYFELRGWKF